MKFTEEMINEDEKRWHARDVVAELGYCGNYMRDRKVMTNNDIRFYAYIMRKAYYLLKEQEVRELTIDEWREWKANPKRNPICELWENDTSPMWILNPNNVHEPALLMGKLKLFTGKPTFEQCQAVKWKWD